MLVLFVILLSANVFAGINDGLVAHYSFNGNAQDSTSYANHGQVFGAALTTGRLGVPNTAYYFNGTDNYIKVNDSPSLHINGQITVSCWFYHADTTSVANRAFVTKRFMEAGFSLRTESWPRFNVGSTNFSEVSTSNIQLTNGWYQMTGTYDGQTMKLFLNGNLIATRYYPNQLTENSEPMFIGAYVSGESNTPWSYFVGAIDDLKIYNRCLSDQEVQNLYLYDNSPTENLKSLIDDILKLNLKAGISNALDVKLENAIKALDEKNLNNNVAVINLLQAFINQCSAQRGVNIPAESADDLISKAQNIIALINLQ